MIGLGCFLVIKEDSHRRSLAIGVLSGFLRPDESDQKDQRKAGTNT